jgi:hypothetical protein
MIENLIRIEVGLETAEEGLKASLEELRDRPEDSAVEAEILVVQDLLMRVSDALRDLHLYRMVLREGGLSSEDGKDG